MIALMLSLPSAPLKIPMFLYDSHDVLEALGAITSPNYVPEGINFNGGGELIISLVNDLVLDPDRRLVWQPWGTIKVSFKTKVWFGRLLLNLICCQVFMAVPIRICCIKCGASTGIVLGGGQG